MSESGDTIRAANLENRLEQLETQMEKRFDKIDSTLNRIVQSGVDVGVRVALLEEREKNLIAIVTETRATLGEVQKENGELKAVLRLGKLAVGGVGLVATPAAVETISKIVAFLGSGG